jgi:chromosome segregation ATPase
LICKIINIRFSRVDQLEDKNTEIESNRTKWNQKEIFFNKKLVKLQQLQFTIDNLNKEITQHTQNLNEAKDENSKLQLKLSEQSNRYRELKQKHDELVKTVSSKVRCMHTF